MRVVIAEDLFLLREGLASLLKEHGFDIAGTVGDGPSLLRALIELRGAGLLRCSTDSAHAQLDKALVTFAGARR